jgi:chorismate mutase
MPRVIRALLTYETESGGQPVPVYLDGAEGLRPDLFRGS